MACLNDVRNFIIENFLFGDGANLKEDTSFLENGIIDSTGILELITYLEEKYNIQIEDNELIPENLDSLNNVAGFLEKKLNSQESKVA